MINILEFQHSDKAVLKKIETITKVMTRYYEDIPRFMIEGMNQAEFIEHLVSIGFNTGIAFAIKQIEVKRND